MLWVGDATHDIGFERDQRNNGVTHKIDPDIDLERDYVEKTLASTGLVTEISHFLPGNPMKEAKTATAAPSTPTARCSSLNSTNLLLLPDGRVLHLAGPSR